MYYIVYKTTNHINGKFYIGKHATTNIDDGYMGSGTLLKRAFRKYGKSAFECEILHTFSSEKRMNLAERILVVPDIETNYNISYGGNGGFGYINKNVLTPEMLHKRAVNGGRKAGPLARGKPRSDAVKRHLSIIKTGKKMSPEARRNISESKKGNQYSKGKIPWNKGIPRSEATRRKISEALYARNKNIPA